MPVKKIILFVFLVLVSIITALLVFYLFKKREISTSIDTTTFEIISEDPTINLFFNNKELLEYYARQFRVSDDMGIGILIKDPYRVDWASPKKIIIVYTLEQRRLVDIYDSKGQPFLTFEPVIDGRNEKTVYLYFNFDTDSVDEEIRHDRERLEREMSAAIVSILYKITHYGPKSMFKEEDRRVILQEIDQSRPIIGVEIL